MNDERANLVGCSRRLEVGGKGERGRRPVRDGVDTWVRFLRLGEQEADSSPYVGRAAGSNSKRRHTF